MRRALAQQAFHRAVFHRAKAKAASEFLSIGNMSGEAGF